MGGQRERVRGQSRELLYSIPTGLCEEIARFYICFRRNDLTDGAGQKRDLRTMEPVSDIIGHCFVVGDNI